MRVDSHYTLTSSEFRTTNWYQYHYERDASALQSRHVSHLCLQLSRAVGSTDSPCLLLKFIHPNVQDAPGFDNRNFSQRPRTYKGVCAFSRPQAFPWMLCGTTISVGSTLGPQGPHRQGQSDYASGDIAARRRVQ
ncbi:hypothetical protein J7T55_010264 [Diaporthe amygdali]|uniref:uncharacterized protein n=1 Tax=Phomopsis amygdali TaxID=1214568 RepID=UPI0022FE44F2|nr:uncharacterized protein J7T55_010264 [Diaporthe amygdali]KAJ0107659.1 hypothetical protein J7T55_010264 [Diaporthe amygdali]